MASSDHSRNGDKRVLVPRIDSCLDFANTLAWRGTSPTESLHSFADLFKWCGDAGWTTVPTAQKLQAWTDKHPKRAADIFTEAIILREAIYRVFHSVASG